MICPAAVSNVERCELEPAATRAMNVDGTLALAAAARAVGAPFVFFSSEYVFDGTDGPYDEERDVNPINEYGRQKVEVEQALPELTGGEFIVARVSCVYGHERRRKNFVFQLWAALSEGREFRTPGDQIGTPTAAANAAEVVRDLVEAGERGVFHVAGAERMLRSDLARVAAQELGLDAGLIRPVATDELGLAAPRPLGAGLLIDRASAAARTPLLGPRDGIRQMLAAGADRGERLMQCRSCGAEVRSFLDLGSTPLANSFLKKEQLDSGEPSFPLEVGFCETCTLVQLMHTVPPEQIFRDYVYVTSTSSSITEHFHALAREAVSRFGLTADDLVVEIGSNDGTLLRGFEPSGIRTLGIEPATNIAEIARSQRHRDRQRVLRARHRAPGARGARAGVVHGRLQRGRAHPRPERHDGGRCDPARRRGRVPGRGAVPAGAARPRGVRHRLPRALLLLLPARARARDAAPRPADLRRRASSRTCTAARSARRCAAPAPPSS